jgi:hypothetical protein
VELVIEHGEQLVDRLVVGLVGAPNQYVELFHNSSSPRFTYVTIAYRRQGLIDLRAIVSRANLDASRSPDVASGISRRPVAVRAWPPEVTHESMPRA